jgi:hypothetical protein
VNIRLRKVQIIEKGTRHKLIVMLAGMNQNVLDRFNRGFVFPAGARHYPAVVRVDGGDDGRNLHEIRPGAYDGKNFHAAILGPLNYPASSLIFQL